MTLSARGGGASGGGSFALSTEPAPVGRRSVGGSIAPGAGGNGPAASSAASGLGVTIVGGASGIVAAGARDGTPLTGVPPTVSARVAGPLVFGLGSAGFGFAPGGGGGLTEMRPIDAPPVDGAMRGFDSGAPVAASDAFTFDKIEGIFGAAAGSRFAGSFDASVFFGGGFGGPRFGTGRASSTATGWVRARRVGESAFLISARFERSGAKSEPLSTSIGMSIERSAIAAAAAAASASTSTRTSVDAEVAAGSLSMRMTSNAASTSASSIGVSCGGVARRLRFGFAGFWVFARLTSAPRSCRR